MGIASCLGCVSKWNRTLVWVCIFLFMMVTNAIGQSNSPSSSIVDLDRIQGYVEYFNRMEVETIRQAIPNDQAWEWMEQSIPFFECSQDNFEEIYYFRWWTFRKHIRSTPQGFALTEFLVPRSYADQHNLISCALGHHIMEGRWLRDPRAVNENLHVWFRGNQGKPMAKLHKFSNWAAFAAFQKYLVDGDERFLIDLLTDFKGDFEFWESEHLRSDGLFWQYDVRDGMEEQISGGRKDQNARPTINSYMAGNARAIQQIALLANDAEAAKKFGEKADKYQQLIHERLWNSESKFFEVRKPDGAFAGVRELIGYLPWYFDLATQEHETAWAMLSDERGFLAPWGMTTAERSHPLFRSHGCCNCEWDGAIWPFATSQTLTAFANRLQNQENTIANKEIYFQHLERYVESQYHRGRPYIGEYLDERDGAWLKGDQERSRYYNHSTYVDLIINGLIGLRPRADRTIEIHPLVPEKRWKWFALERVPYHGRQLSVLWDEDGTRYQHGKGLIVFLDGKEIGRSQKLERLVLTDALP